MGSLGDFEGELKLGRSEALGTFLGGEIEIWGKLKFEVRNLGEILGN